MRGGCGLEILRAGRVRVRDSSCGAGAGRVRVRDSSCGLVWVG